MRALNGLALIVTNSDDMRPILFPRDTKYVLNRRCCSMIADGLVDCELRLIQATEQRKSL